MKTYTRNCPKCNDLITYTHPSSYYGARKKGSSCRRCASNASGFLDRYASEANSGEANAFFGKKHTDDTKRCLSLVDKSSYQTDEFRSKMREACYRGSDHYMYGVNRLEFLANKHGYEQAVEMEANRRKRSSEANSGEGNPMFGRPAPQGSGCGWKGWYKGWFFRSLRELSFVVKTLESSGLKWISAETKQLAIPYDDPLGTKRTYFADFLVENRLLVEVKPLRLHATPTVQLKQLAAINFCKERGLTYEMIDPVRLTDLEITALHDEGLIKFRDEYERKYRERATKNSRGDEGASGVR